MAEHLRELKTLPQWQSFADMALISISDCKSNLIKMDLESHSIEQIAKDRIKWTAMIHGMERLFIDMNGLIKELTEEEKKKQIEREEKKNG